MFLFGLQKRLRDAIRDCADPALRTELARLFNVVGSLISRLMPDATTNSNNTANTAQEIQAAIDRQDQLIALYTRQINEVISQKNRVMHTRNITNGGVFGEFADTFIKGMKGLIKDSRQTKAHYAQQLQRM